MLKYLLKKTAGWLLVVFLATNIAYFLAATFLDPRANYAGRRPPIPHDKVTAILEPLNLSDTTPLLDRWWTWLTNILLHWDWGRSPVNTSVNEEISYRIWVSAQLLLLATIVSVIIGVAVGIYTASRQYKVGDRVWQGISILTMNLHVIVASMAVVAVALMINDAAGTRIFYVTGASNPGIEGFFPRLVDLLQHLALPTLSLLIISYAGYHLMQRTLLLDNLAMDYVRTARAKGSPASRRSAATRFGRPSSRWPRRWRSPSRASSPAPSSRSRSSPGRAWATTSSSPSTKTTFTAQSPSPPSAPSSRPSPPCWPT